VATCPKCGSNVSEEMSFCPRCGASLKAEQVTARAPPVTYRKDEKAEKREKSEKSEKGEKREKGEYSFVGLLIGGLIVMLVGLVAYVDITGIASGRLVWAVFLVIIGLVIIIGAIYVALTVPRRHPKPLSHPAEQ